MSIEVNRQYIGARYVPKFFENPNTGDSTWLEGVGYEPLTIVTYAGNSFTSKKPVPAGVGSPNMNHEYWVNTGNYNAQVAGLRTDIDRNAESISHLSTDLEETSEELNHKIDETAEELNNKIEAARQFILIGDSFGGGVDGDNNTQAVEGGGWIQRFQNSVSGWASVYNNQTPLGGVYGFASSRPFLDVLRDAETHVPDKTKITDIVVLGGSNDVGLDPATIVSKIQEFCAYVHSNYPRARLAIGCLGSNGYNMVKLGSDAYSKCRDYGAEYISDLRTLYSLKEYIGADGTHLKREGYAFYTPYVNQAILTGKSDWYFTGAIQMALTSSYISAVTPVFIECTLTNRNVKIGLRAEPAGDTKGMAILTAPGGASPGFDTLGAQNYINAMPVPYGRCQALICEGNIFELYVDASDAVCIAVSASASANSQIKTGMALAQTMEY